MCSIKNTTLRLNFTYSGCNNRSIWQHNTVITTAAQEILWKRQNKRLSASQSVLSQLSYCYSFHSSMLTVHTLQCLWFVVLQNIYPSQCQRKRLAVKKLVRPQQQLHTVCLTCHCRCISEPLRYFFFHHPQSNVEVDTPVSGNKSLNLVIETWEITSGT